MTINYIKINKKDARKAYNEGKTVGILPSNYRPGNPWVQTLWFNKSEYEDLEMDFDRVVDDFTYWNCNREVGLSCAYYIKA